MVQVKRVEVQLPSHRDDIFGFLESYNKACSPAATAASVSTAHEHSQSSTSAESGKKGRESGAPASAPLLNAYELTYLRNYGRELFEDMVQSQHKAIFPQLLLSNQEEITRELRASVIDWLLECADTLKVQDKQIFFQAINLMDRFYAAQQSLFPAKDLQLTAVTALFIASKNLEVDPLNLKTCREILCFNKYSK